MAEITSVNLSTDPNSFDPINVTVKFKLSFTANETGQKFRYAIRLRPADWGLGTNPDEDPSPSVLYTFRFGSGTFTTNTKTITANPFTTTPGQPLTETRDVPREKLNEDPDSHLTGPLTAVRNRDEFYAAVTLIKGESGPGTIADERISNVVTMHIE